MTSVAFGLFTLALLVPSIVLHEIAHGYVSLRHGDPTARDAGRLSLNPLRHVDPFGTVLLPLLLWSAGAPVFGYAKPVPINPAHYADLRHGQLATGLAGPAANLVLALLGAGVAWAAWLARRGRRRRDGLAVARRRCVHRGEPGADVLQPDPDPAA